MPRPTPGFQAAGRPPVRRPVADLMRRLDQFLPGRAAPARRKLSMRLEDRGQVLRRFFAGLTEYAFHTRLGVTDPPLVDYLSELLVRFVRSDELYPVRTTRGQRIVQVVDMLAEAEHR